jgi:hypothetical protein
MSIKNSLNDLIAEYDNRIQQLNAELTQMRRTMLEQEQAQQQVTKHMNRQIDSLIKYNRLLRDSTCVWVCLECHAEFYGQIPGEKSHFNCLYCKNKPCMPKRYYNSSPDFAETMARAHLTRIKG